MAISSTTFKQPAFVGVCLVRVQQPASQQLGDGMPAARKRGDLEQASPRDRVLTFPGPPSQTVPGSTDGSIRGPSHRVQPGSASSKTSPIAR